jgi:hypothetical protein
MSGPIEELLEAAGPALSETPSIEPESVEADVEQELMEMLAEVNGFYAFEAALHVFPVTSGEHMDLVRWNSATLWRDAYGSLADDLVFFAEDAFGGQFALADEGVVSFDPETGDAELIAATLEGWAAQLLADYELLTGFPLAHEWQERFGALPVGARLLPKTPFVLGGEFAVNNLFAGDAVAGMRMRGDVALQLRDHPDGTTVVYRVVS